MGMGQATRGLDTITAVSALLTSLQRERIGSFCEELLANRGQYGGILVVNGHDCTPNTVRFEQDSVCAMKARYWVKDDGGEWEQVDYDEYRRRYPRRRSPGKGSLELFAQVQSLHVETIGAAEDRRHISQDILIPPIFLARGNAFNLHEGRQQVPLIIAELCKLAAVHELLIVSECPDGGSAGVREAEFVHQQLPGNVLYHQGICGVHTCHRISAQALDEDSHIGDVYSVQYITTNASLCTRLCKAWWSRAARACFRATARALNVETRSGSCCSS